MDETLTDKQLQAKIRQVNRKFNELEALFNTIPAAQRDKLDNCFHEEGTIRHCIRWGVQTSREMLEILKEGIVKED